MRTRSRAPSSWRVPSGRGPRRCRGRRHAWRRRRGRCCSPARAGRPPDAGRGGAARRPLRRPRRRTGTARGRPTSRPPLRAASRAAAWRSPRSSASLPGGRRGPRRGRARPRNRRPRAGVARPRAGGRSAPRAGAPLRPEARKVGESRGLPSRSDDTVASVPKTLTGTELELDDGPARDAELFIVDGNNLAYRAFFALPEELATTDGQPTGALLGFTNMLFKLLADYRPKGVAVAWDSRPVHRAAVAEAAEVVYKEGRRAMPDLLREQFPHFRPIVEAFGYRNLEFEGWEADDVIATLATRADESGVKTCVVSTDRDAFQLVSENVCLMMTPRGVSDVNVYTPDRVEARYGVTPEQVPDFIGLKGDTSDNIPGVPGIGDKTAGQLIAQYGSVEAVIEHVSELSPARARNITEHADAARLSKELATKSRDLDNECGPAALVPAPPVCAQLKEIFRRFEFRNLLNRVD